MKNLVKAEWVKRFGAWGDFDLRCAELVKNYGQDNCKHGHPKVHSEVHALCDILGCPYSEIF